ncbi:hypothetical protein COO60DRAFT_571858 [Scenedesmus sp. NREL 46B-D3]|nr:hypothetical protein COO60DRAFT_571858 [Scenedesmus sp. NREL 46B-D3]
MCRHVQDVTAQNRPRTAELVYDDEYLPGFGWPEYYAVTATMVWSACCSGTHKCYASIVQAAYVCQYLQGLNMCCTYHCWSCPPPSADCYYGRAWLQAQPRMPAVCVLSARGACELLVLHHLLLCHKLQAHHHHHHHITHSSHSISAIGPAPHRGGKRREHCSRMFACIAHIPRLDKKSSNTR